MKSKKYRKYPEELLTKAVQYSTSIAQVASFLNIKNPGGGTYTTLNKYIDLYDLSTSHFTSVGTGKNAGNQRLKVPIEDYLSNKKKVNCTVLKERLFREKILEEKCYECGLKDWQNKPITLQIEHINGDHCDNSLSNLTILCPNCHSQTPTFNRGKASLNHSKEIDKFCKCGRQIHKNSIRCKSCSARRRFSLVG